jgi:hypothetical protein
MSVRGTIMGSSLVVLISCGLMGADKPIAPVDGLLSSDGIVREQTQKALLEERATLAKRLTEIILDKKYQREQVDSVRRAIFLAGEERLAECVPALVQEISFPRGIPASVPATRPSRLVPKSIGMHDIQGVGSMDLDEYPAVAALIKIGEPSFDAVISRFIPADNIVDQYCCIEVLVRVRKHSGAMLLVKEALAVQHIEKKKEGLKLLLEMLENSRPKNESATSAPAD